MELVIVLYNMDIGLCGYKIQTIRQEVKMEFSTFIMILAPFVIPILGIIFIKEIINQVNDSKEKKRRKMPMDQSFKPFKFDLYQ